jgi:hypothetical protein
VNRWYCGNAGDDGPEQRGWFVGHFPPEENIRRTGDVEVKWGVHPGGDERHGWQEDETRTTLLLLVDGRFRIDLSVGSHVLARPGDYAMWGRGIGHTWRAEEDPVVVTVRLPSSA